MSNVDIEELPVEQHNEQPTANDEQEPTVTLPITTTTSVPSLPEETTTQEETTKAKQRGGRKKATDSPDLKEKVQCPDCSKTVSLHSLKFTHKKYCKAQKIAIEPVEAEQPAHQLINALEVTPTANPEVHYVQYDPTQVVSHHIHDIKHNKKAVKQSKYKEMLTGRI